MANSYTMERFSISLVPIQTIIVQTVSGALGATNNYAPLSGYSKQLKVPAIPWWWPRSVRYFIANRNDPPNQLGIR